MIRRRAARAKPAVAAVVAVLALELGGCAHPLPEAGTADAALYESRCGTCHRVYDPGALTPAMWRVQVDRMIPKYRSAGMRPPADAEKDQIVAYLVRNSGAH